MMNPHSTFPKSLHGSAIITVLCVLALISLLLISLLHSVRIERATTASASAGEQSYLTAESGASTACTLLMQLSSNRPAYLVGLAGEKIESDIRPCLIIGNTNLTNKSQLVPLFSHDLSETVAFPKLSEKTLDTLLAKRLSTNPAETVDLNDPQFVEHPIENSSQGGIIDSSGHYPALWQKLHNSEGKVVGRYAFILTDESACLNPLLHQGNPRNHPTDWDKGPKDIPLTNNTSVLFTPQEAKKLRKIAEMLPTEKSFEAAFATPQAYEEKRSLLTRDPCLTPDLIPAGMPEGGLPKYNLNDLATNTAWGATSSARAENIASIIDKNLPKFKLRDASLAGRGSDPTLYLRRLACSIVDYISKEPGPTGTSGGEPSGRDLVPYVTQIAERCTRTAFTSNSVTIESRFFAEVWNPTTSTIPAGGIPRLVISNRAQLTFGNGLVRPFATYDKTASALPALRPNEFLVIAFNPVQETWTSPEPTTIPPHWEKGPNGNTDAIHHQFFAFYWNGRLADRSRPPKSSSDIAAGGLTHFAQKLQDASPRWQSMSIPTWSSTADERQEQDTSDEAIQTGNYRFVGDPRATFLTAYKWNAVTNYPSKTLWNGISPAGILGKGYLMDPAATWTRRDRIPVDPVRGNPPSSDTQTPDLIPSSYRVNGEGSEAPFVIRKGPMLSLGELGHIFDPAQVDDLLQAPSAGVPSSLFCSGGGRTLRIGQPEFQAFNPSADWDAEGKRAVELLDIFTVSDAGRSSGTNLVSTNVGIPGRMNVNTAPLPVLTALFSGISVTSDSRFTNSQLSSHAISQLATFIEKNRPYSRLSELRTLTPMLCDAENFSPRLGKNVLGSSPPVADVFDRAREEAFGKIIGHCIFQTRTFHLVVIGESLSPAGKPTGRAIMESLIRLTPDASGRLIPELQDIQWH
jgi:hypothetical protein